MKPSLLNRLLASALAVGLLLIGASNPVFASTTTISDTYKQDLRLKCYGESTADTTFATTSYADLTGASCSVTPTRYDPTAATNGVADLLVVTYSLDVTKATATTAVCAVYANGAVVATTARTLNYAAAQGVLAGRFIIPNSTVGAQTVKLQCKSGDTNTATVKLGHWIVEEYTRYK